MSKSKHVWGAIALAMFVAAGCQETTTTGPAVKTTATGAPAVKKLTVMAAKSQTIKVGDTDKITVAINRDNFDDPVTIRLNDLPSGVTCNDAVIPSGKNSITLELKAQDNAQVGEFRVQIDANAPGLGENVQTFTLTVKDKS